MLRPESSLSPNQQNGTSPSSEQPDAVPPTGGVDIQQELNTLEEFILSNPRVPFTGRTLIDEDQLLDQLDLIRLNLPPAFREATRVLQQRDAIIAEAQRYAQELVAAAEQEAAARLDELGIVRQAEQLAQQIKGQTQQECEQLRSQTLAEIDQLRIQAQREWESMRQRALSEKDAIEADADNYADRVLLNLEQQLAAMLHTIQNGRSQLNSPAIPEATPSKNRSQYAPRDPQTGHRPQRSHRSQP